MTNNKIVDTLVGGVTALCLIGGLYAAYPVQMKMLGIIVLVTAVIGWGMGWLLEERHEKEE